MTEVVDFRAVMESDFPLVAASLLEQYGSFVDQATGVIGRVVASEKEPSGAHTFHFWAADDARTVDVGHIVIAFSEDAAIIGVVDEPRRYSDLRSFLDDYFDRRLEEALADEPPTKRPEILVFTAHVLATRHRRDDVVSLRPATSGPVYFATRAAIADALGAREFDGPAIPALLHVNGNAERTEDGQPLLDDEGQIVFQRSPIAIDSHYLLGPEAGHSNWTGQSGLATKTSHVQFLTSAVFQSMRKEGETVAALMFNVKGADLLWMDKPATPPDELAVAYDEANSKGLSERDLEAYAALGLEPEPFDQLRIYAPFKPGQVPAEDSVRFTANRYHANLNTLRNSPAETSIVYPVLFQLDDFLGQPHKIFDKSDMDDKLLGFVYHIRSYEKPRTMADLRALRAKIDRHFATQGEDGKFPGEWQGHHPATIQRAWNRLQNLPAKFAGLVAEGQVEYGDLPEMTARFSDQEVRVVDISQCNTEVQAMLVTRAIQNVWRRAEEKDLGVKHLIVFVDELNKYAEAGSESALRDTLVDIAARGRHLSVVLFGAQQFRSKVDDEILGNCGTSFYGRIGDEEIINSAYRSIPETARQELLGLRKGTLLIRHAHFRAPVFGAFPRPPVISGTAGQKVFNTDQERVGGLAGEGLWRLMQRYGDPVTKNEVLTACLGLSANDVDIVSQSVEPMLIKNQNKTAAQIPPWTIASNYLRSKKQSRGR